MGLTRTGFAQAVIAVVQRHAPDFDAATLEMRPSRREVSVAHLYRPRDLPESDDDLYRELCDTRWSRWCCEGVHVRVKAWSVPGARVMPSPGTRTASPVVRRLGVLEYRQAYDAMRQFTREREAGTPDEIWLLEHPPVSRLDRRANPATCCARARFRWSLDRGGQITYHGPGQIVAYTLLDLRRLGLDVRSERWGGSSSRSSTCSPGTASIPRGARRAGHIRARRQGGRARPARAPRLCCYHGIALNVDMDLAPFADINPCGFEGLEVTQLARPRVGASRRGGRRNLGQNTGQDTGRGPARNPGAETAPAEFRSHPA